MTTVFLPSRPGVIALRQRNGSWAAELVMDAAQSPAVATDPLAPSRVYAGTFGAGVWKSDDAGRSWRQTGSGIRENIVWSVTVSASERSGGEGIVYCGTEMAALFRSTDGGGTWKERESLLDIPSRPNWRYPPKPESNHVRCILCDPTDEGRLLVGIEQGGIMLTKDAGETWRDHNQQACIDPHTLAAPPSVPGRYYECSGDGFAVSEDHGESWRHEEAGVERRYLYSMATDPQDPDTVVITGSQDYRKAHNPHDAESQVYRRTNGEAWHEVADGLPDPVGQQTHHLGTHPAEPGVFYLATVSGRVFRSNNAGQTWSELEIEWPEGLEVANVRGVVPAAD